MEVEIVLLLSEVREIDCNKRTKDILFLQLKNDVVYNIHDEDGNYVVVENVDGLCFATTIDTLEIK